MKETDKQTLNDWFQFREVVDDEKFPIFFARALNLYYNHYLELIRIEPGLAHYDWFVADYHETQTNTRTTTSSSGNSHSTGNNNGNSNTTNTTKDGREITNKTTHSGKDETTNTSDGTNENHEKTQNNNVAAQKTLPQDSSGVVSIKNNIGSVGSSGNMVAVDTLQLKELEYASAFSEGSTESANNTNGTTHDESKGSTTYGQVIDNTQSVTGDLVVENNNENHSDNSSTTDTSSTGNTTGEMRNISTGRTAMTAAAIIREAVPVIEATIAFSWLKEKLEPCFMAVYDI